jgi:hypothetical protein
MGNIRPAPEALLFQAATVNDIELFGVIDTFLIRRYGEILNTYGPFQFDAFSSYYRDEMGASLWKKFYIFKNLVTLENVYRYKTESQSIETIFSTDNRRDLNLDPGYLTLYQFALLTTKAFSHRTYLADGIYTECTLIAKGNGFEPLPWTYPDYKTADALDFFKEAKKYLKTVTG